MEEKNHIKITEDQGIVIITFMDQTISGVSDVENLSGQIKAYISDNYPRKVVVNFQNVKFFSSQTLGMLLDLWRKMQGYNGRIVISGINPQLHRVFKITNLDKIFSFYPDIESACGALKEN
ncbi:MAG: STAS domain-containing protein [Planctomycetota bacterium]